MSMTDFTLFRIHTCNRKAIGRFEGKETAISARRQIALVQRVERAGEWIASLRSVCAPNRLLDAAVCRTGAGNEFLKK